MSVDNLSDHEALVQALMDPQHWPEGGPDRRRIDTHISSVILAGEHAFKIKKPIDLGFLDFLSLESRQHWCKEELRLNRRTAPQIYQSVRAITGSIEHPQLDGAGEVIDWAVQMRRFDPDALLATQPQLLTREIVLQLAEAIADFHAAAAIVSDPQLGRPAAVFAPMQENFRQLRGLGEGSEQLDRLEHWTTQTLERHRSLLEQRRDEGHVRECHGDLHLGNIALIDGAPVIFDAIEFNPGLRWIDTINDLAFLSMDLRERGHAHHVHLLLDRYLQISGDYPGLALLRFYEVYRALVRAKVAAIRLAQPQLDAQEKSAAREELHAYLQLAEDLARERKGAVVITHGLSGSGKSYITRNLPAELPAIRLRSDVERKRLLDIPAQQSAVEQDGYSADITERTYQRLTQLAEVVAGNGHVAVVDATFLKARHRRQIRAMAANLDVPCVILDCRAPDATLEQRIAQRHLQSDNVSDADVQVLRAQQQSQEPLSEEERAQAIVVSPQQPLDVRHLQQMLAVDSAYSAG